MFGVVKDYISKRISLARLDIVERSAYIVSKALYGVIILFISLFVLLFLNIALACYLYKVLDSAVLSALIVGSIYLIVLALVLIFSKAIKGFIVKRMIEMQINYKQQELMQDEE